MGYKEYGPTGVVPGLGCGCQCPVNTSNHLVCLMGSVLVWEAAVKSLGLIRNWWLIQEVSVLHKAMGDPLALGLSARGNAKLRCWVSVDMRSCYSGGPSPLTTSQLGSLNSDCMRVLSQLLWPVPHLPPQKLMQSG